LRDSVITPVVVHSGEVFRLIVRWGRGLPNPRPRSGGRGWHAAP
jgi:hypothetical protein